MSNIMNKFIWFALAHSRLLLAIFFILVAGSACQMLVEIWVLDAITEALPQLEQDLLYIRPFQVSA